MSESTKTNVESTKTKMKLTALRKKAKKIKSRISWYIKNLFAKNTTSKNDLQLEKSIFPGKKLYAAHGTKTYKEYIMPSKLNEDVLQCISTYCRWNGFTFEPNQFESTEDFVSQKNKVEKLCKDAGIEGDYILWVRQKLVENNPTLKDIDTFLQKHSYDQEILSDAIGGVASQFTEQDTLYFLERSQWEMYYDKHTQCVTDAVSALWGMQKLLQDNKKDIHTLLQKLKKEYENDRDPKAVAESYRANWMWEESFFYYIVAIYIDDEKEIDGFIQELSKNPFAWYSCLTILSSVKINPGYIQHPHTFFSEIRPKYIAWIKNNS